MKNFYVLIFALILGFTACVTQKVEDKKYEQWAYMDGIYVDDVDTIYDPVSKSIRLVSIIGNDTIWDFNSTRLYISTDSGLYWLDKNGDHKF